MLDRAYIDLNIGTNRITFNPPEVVNADVANEMNKILGLFKLNHIFKVRFQAGYLQIGRKYKSDVRAWFMLAKSKSYRLNYDEDRGK